MFHNLFVFDNIVSYILYASLLAYLHWRVTEGHTPLWSKVTIARETVVAVVLPLTLVVGGLMVWYVNVPGITTSRLLITALIPQQQLPDGTVVRQTPEDMLAAYRRALEIDQLGRQEVREQLAQRAAQMNRSEEVSDATKQAYRDLALAEMEAELARNPNSARLQLFMGSLYGNIGRIQDAETVLVRAVELTPTKQTALIQLGEIKVILGKTEEGLALFKQAFELAPEYRQARTMYAMALIRTGSDKEAVDLLTEEYGTPAVDDSRLFMAWIDAKRFDIAAMILEERVAKNPGDVQQAVSLAAAYKELGRMDEAVALLSDVAERYPEYADQMQQFITELQQK
jgi:cytochrome c-type biogenesis protein CcmH/NrfG